MSRTAANRSVLSLSALGLVISGGILFAGPLNPPAGPVASTHKTLSEVEPRMAVSATNTPGDATSLFRITQPGSYYLTGNITGVAGKHGIAIAASGVTIDLCGFELAGVPAMGAFDGVSIAVSGLSSIAVVNGSVRNWGGDGIDLFTNGASNSRLEGVRSSGNAGNGMSLAQGGAATNCSVRSNTQHGIFASGGCTITGCSVSANNGNGINSGSGCTITACTLYQNGTGISTGDGCTVSNCTSYNNNGHGISVTSGCLVANCCVRANMFDGIAGTSGNVIRDNACDLNGNGGNGAGVHTIGVENYITANRCTGATRGIDVDGSRNIITRNSCSGNATNWDVAAGNVILVINASSSGAVLGNFGGVAPGSTDPSANFTN